MKTFITIICLCATLTALGQRAHFISGGTIVYEKTINLYGLLKQRLPKDPDNITRDGIEKYKAAHPQFKKFTGTLVFQNGKTLYSPEDALPEKVYDYTDPMAAPGNQVYSDLVAKTSVTQKNIIDQLFMVQDSLRKINWRYTGATRDIAGYTCRRASAIIMDSVYVVAFYTEKIHTQGGPESFTGLPGMILGVALPYENVTWFATKVIEGEPEALKIPQKGKATNRQKLDVFLQDKMKTWGKQKYHERKVYLL